jgi:hypothetical protein
MMILSQYHIFELDTVNIYSVVWWYCRHGLFLVYWFWRYESLLWPCVAIVDVAFFFYLDSGRVGFQLGPVIYDAFQLLSAFTVKIVCNGVVPKNSSSQGFKSFQEVRLIFLGVILLRRWRWRKRESSQQDKRGDPWLSSDLRETPKRAQPADLVKL